MSDLLATYDQSWPARCPNRPYTDLVELNSGLLLPAGCYSLGCPVCVQTIARRYSGAIGLAQPDQHVRLTQVGDRWETIHPKLNLFRRNLRRLGRLVRDVFHIERNPAGTGNHAHLWTYGSQLDVPIVSTAAIRAGMGAEVWVGPRARPAGAPLWYGMKTVLDAAHPTEISPEITDFLEINGGRLLHASRNFWRDADGQPVIGGVRTAAKLARRRHGSEMWATVTTPPGFSAQVQLGRAS